MPLVSHTIKGPSNPFFHGEADVFVYPAGNYDRPPENLSLLGDRADRDDGSGSGVMEFHGLTAGERYFAIDDDGNWVVFRAPAASSIAEENPDPDPPVVVTGVADDILATTVTLNGTVNPRGTATTYYFEYGADTTYGTEIPVGLDGDAGELDVAGAVDEGVTGLTAETLYHFRLVAENSAGVTNGADATFTTAAA